jgi:hypothetical protein
MKISETVPALKSCISFFTLGVWQCRCNNPS